MRRLLACIISAEVMIFGSNVVFGESYPTKIIRIVTAAPGGGNDFAVRVIAPLLSDSLGQQVIIDNRGGNAAIPAKIVSEAAPDGYTLLAYNNAMWTLPLLQRVPYSPVRDFSPITLSMNSPLILVVHPSIPAKSVKDLITLAKARPGELNYGSGDTGGSGHLAAELFKAMAAVKIVQISYKGTGPTLNATIGGETQLMFPNAGPVTSHIRSGRLRALAVSSIQPSALTPGLPTIAETVPGYEASSIYGIFAPAKTPAALVNRLNQEIVRVLNRPEVKERYFNAGVEIVGSLPDQLATTVKAEVARLAKVIRDAGIRAE